MSCPLLMLPDQDCDRCHQPRLLLARTCKGRLCGVCWHDMGEPPSATLTVQEREAARELLR